MAGPVSRAAFVAAALLSVALVACGGGAETRPQPGAEQGPGLDGGFVARAVDDVCANVSRASAAGWPAHLPLSEEGRPRLSVEVTDQRGRGSADGALLAQRLEDRLVGQGLVEVVPPAPGGAGLVAQAELRAEGAATWIEVRLFDRQQQKILARTLLRDPPQ